MLTDTDAPAEVHQPSAMLPSASCSNSGWLSASLYLHPESQTNTCVKVTPAPRIPILKVGKLMYLMLGTCPDIASAVGAISQHVTLPQKEHWQAAKRILRYLKGEALMSAFVSVARRPWINFTDTLTRIGRRIKTAANLSPATFSCLVGGGGAISWVSKKQAIVALSSTEAEYVAASQATQEAMWLRDLLTSMHSAQKQPTALLEDNEGAIALTHNQVFHVRTKHIAVK